MTQYTIALTPTFTPELAGAQLAQVVTKHPRVTCPVCGQSITTYSVAGTQMIDYHRTGANWTWCDGSDYNTSEATE